MKAKKRERLIQHEIITNALAKIKATGLTENEWCLKNNIERKTIYRMRTDKVISLKTVAQLEVALNTTLIVANKNLIELATNKTPKTKYEIPSNEKLLFNSKISKIIDKFSPVAIQGIAMLANELENIIGQGFEIRCPNSSYISFNVKINGEKRFTKFKSYHLGFIKPSRGTRIELNLPNHLKNDITEENLFEDGVLPCHIKGNSDKEIGFPFIILKSEQDFRYNVQKVAEAFNGVYHIHKNNLENILNGK